MCKAIRGLYKVTIRLYKAIQGCSKAIEVYNKAIVMLYKAVFPLMGPLKGIDKGDKRPVPDLLQNVMGF